MAGPNGWLKLGAACANVMVRRAMVVLYAVCVSVLWRAPVASAQPANDLCENAEVITVPGTFARTSAGASGTDLSPFGLQCGFEDTADVWFRVPGGASTRQFLADVTTDSDFLTFNVAAYTACPITGTDSIIACYAVPATIVFSVPPGQDVYIRVAADDQNAGAFIMTLNWFDVVTPPPGDDCGSPLTISVGQSVTGMFAGYSGHDVSSCLGANFDAADLWYSLTIPPGQGGTYVISTAGSAIDTVLSLFTACPTANGQHEIACDDDVRPFRDSINRPAVQTSEIGLHLDSGQYLVRVSSFLDQQGAYVLNVSNRRDPIPGDACVQAIAIAADTTVAGTTVGLTGFNLSGGCTSNDRTDAWFVFTPQRNGVYTIQVSTASGVLFPAVRLYGACGGPQLRCGYSSTAASELAYVMQAGEDYYVRVAGNNSLTGGFNLRINSPPVNDFCEQALPVPTTQAQPFVASITGSTANAYSIWDQGDIAFNTQGVWYAFTAPTTGWYRISTEGSVMIDTELVVTDACRPLVPGSGANVIAANDDILASGSSPNRWSRVDARLVGGQTYFIEVSTGDNAVFQGPREFVLNVTQVAQPASVPNDTCEQAMVITPGFSMSQDARGSTEDANVPSCYYTGFPVNPLQPAETTPYGVWYSFDAIGFGVATFSQVGPSLTTIRVLSAQGAGCGALGGTVGNDRNSYACGSSTVSWNIVDGQRYYILVHSPARSIINGATLTGSYGLQPSAPYAVSLNVAANTGSCCVGSACVVNTKPGCLQQGGTYLGDSATCVKPSGQNAARVLIADSTDQFGSPAETILSVGVSGVSGTVTSVEAHVDVEHYDAKYLSLHLQSPSGTLVTLAGRVTSPGASNCSDLTFYFVNGVYQFKDSSTQDFRQGVHTNALFPDYTLDSGSYAAWDCASGRISLSASFAGQNPNGVWRVIARDYSTFRDFGAIRAVRLYVNGGGGDACAPACRADFNGIGGVTVQDIFDFLSAWFAGNSSADFNNAGGVTVQDIFDFLSAWFLGC